MKRIKIMKRSFSRLLRIAWEEEKLYYLYVILNFICVGIYSYCIIQVPKIVLNMLEEQKIDLPILLALFGLILGSGLVASVCKYLYTPIGFRIRYRILHKINMKTLSVPLEDFENPKILDNMWSIMRPASSVDGIQWFFLNVAELSGNLGIIAISIGVLFQLNIWLSLMVVAWIICYSYLTVLSAERIDLSFKESSGSWRRSEYLKDIAMDVAYAKELRVFALKEWFHKQMTTVLKKLKDSANKMFVVANRISFWDNVYQFLRDIVMYATLIFLFFEGTITLAEFSTYGVLVTQLNSALALAMENVQKVTRNYGQYDQMFDFLDMKDEKQEGRNIEIVDDWNIEFKDVSFHYPGSEKYIYKHLNFTIQKGKKIAVIGLNGVGKTTMMKLLMRLYEPIDGEILLNGVNIKEYSLNKYYDLFAPVFQEINLFPYSMNDNLGFGDDIKEEVARDIFRQVGLDKKLSDYSMDQMMTKYLDEDGLLLSGGESQKFVMARAVCSKRPILILDEPTSALDAIAEYEFYDKINHEYKDKTILFISHRLASTSFCDEIILVDDQNISEYGTHEELMKRKGKYYDLYQIQSKYYREEVEV